MRLLFLFCFDFQKLKRVCSFQVVGGSARPKLLKNVFLAFQINGVMFAYTTEVTL
jgi:hypothetical protein